MTESRRKGDTLFILTVILIAATMRACYTGVGTIVGFIQDDLGMNSTTAGFITTIPILVFAFTCVIIAPLSERFGLGRLLLWGLILTTAGTFLRALGGQTGLFGGTALMCLGIGIPNALLVALIKMRTPKRVGLVTSCYTTTMAVTTAVAIFINVPLTGLIGWRWTLAVYGFIGVAAVLVWAPQSRSEENRAALGRSGGHFAKLFTSPRAWLLTLYMGSQSMLFYCISGWLPSILQWQGMSAADAANAVTVLQLVSLPSTLLLPILAERINWRGLIAVFDGAYIAGMILFWFAPTGSAGMWTAVCLIAVGVGSGFSACLYLFSKKTSSPAQTGAISSFAQLWGYVFAAVGPVLMGRIFDVTGSWNGAMLLAFGVQLLMTVSSLLSADSRSVFKTPKNEKKA